jgi:UDP:flavonoid glycosyltransferase YjiC (YdhE family)
MSETAMRVAWAGSGLSLPWRLCRPTLLKWAARRLLHEPRFSAKAEEIAAWRGKNDGAARGAELVERLALKKLTA